MHGKCEMYEKKITLIWENFPGFHTTNENVQISHDSELQHITLRHPLVNSLDIFTSDIYNLLI